MSSTPTVGTLSFVALTTPSNAPSSPSIVLLTSVTELSISSTVASVTISEFSEQSQQPFSVSQTTMSSATGTTSATPTMGSPSVSSSSVPQTSSLISSYDPSVTTSSDNPSSNPGSLDLSMTPTTTTTTETTTAPFTSPPSSTPQLGTTPSTPMSPIFSTLDTLTTTVFLPATSDSSSQTSSPEITNMPLTTVLQSTTIIITSTNSEGQVVTSVPAVVTEVITTTGNGGVATTVTQAVINPTLAPNNSTSEGSAFFADTGAVVGVFVVVGLAFAAILLWIVFAVRHRQRMARIEQDTAVEAAVAAAGLHRAPLVDDDEGDSPISPSTRRQFRPFSTRMGQRGFWGLGGSASLPPSVRHSEVLDDPARITSSSRPGLPVEHHASGRPEGYVPARTTSPSSRAEQGTNDLSSSRDRKSSYGHTPTYSAGSFEPLLANYTQNMSDQDTADAMEVPRSRSPKQAGTSSVPNRTFLDGNPGDVSGTSFKGRNSSSSSVLRDEEDYTRYVLMVRNLPDNQSQQSS